MINSPPKSLIHSHAWPEGEYKPEVYSCSLVITQSALVKAQISVEDNAQSQIITAEKSCLFTNTRIIFFTVQGLQVTLECSINKIAPPENLTSYELLDTTLNSIQVYISHHYISLQFS